MKTGIFQVFPKSPHFLQLKLQTFSCLGIDSASALNMGEGEDCRSVPVSALGPV